MKYYSITVRCGHVGRYKYLPIEFAIAATNCNEAINKAINIPRVKTHSNKDVLSYSEISYSEYLKIRNTNKDNDYLHASRKSDCYKFLEDKDILKIRKKSNKTPKYHYRYLKEVTLLNSYNHNLCYE